MLKSIFLKLAATSILFFPQLSAQAASITVYPSSQQNDDITFGAAASYPYFSDSTGVAPLSSEDGIYTTSCQAMVPSALCRGPIRASFLNFTPPNICQNATITSVTVQYKYRFNNKQADSNELLYYYAPNAYSPSQRIDILYAAAGPTSQAPTAGSSVITPTPTLANWNDYKFGIGNDGELEFDYIGLKVEYGCPPSIEKSFSPSIIKPGDSSTLTIKVANLTSPSVAVGNLNVLDNLPTPLQVNEAATITNTCGGTLTASGMQISLTGGTLPAGGCVITVPVTWPKTADGIQECGAGKTVTNTITPGTDFTTAGGQVNTPAKATLTCQPIPIKVSKATSITSMPAVGSPVSYTIEIENLGAMAATGISITDNVPSNLSGVSWSCAPSAICPTPTTGSGNINLTNVSLAASSKLTYTLAGTIASVPASGSFTNEVQVDPGTGACENNPAATRCTAQAPIPAVGMVRVKKTTSTAAPVYPGNTISYEVVFENPGTVTATAVQVSDPLASGLDSMSWTCSGKCNLTSGTASLADTLTLLAGEKATYTITAVAKAAGLPARITNEAQAQLSGTQLCFGGTPGPCRSSVGLDTAVVTPPQKTEIPTLNTIALAMLALMLSATAGPISRRMRQG